MGFKQPNFNKVLVLDTNRKPLMPCYPARAKKLLSSGRASVFRRFPFTIILHDRTVEESVLQEVEVKIDQGSKTTGVVIPDNAKTKVPTGTYTGRIAVRSSGHFDVKTKDTKINVAYKYCKPTHLMDGYNYA